MTKAFMPPPDAKVCCRTEGNLYVVTVLDDGGSREVIWKCRICDCRHFDVSITPATFGVRG